MDKKDHFPFIARYLHSPIVDISGGEPFTPRSNIVKDQDLNILRALGTKTLVGYRWNNTDKVADVWSKIAESGYVIFKEITEDVQKAIRKIGCYRVLRKEPMWVLQKVGQRPGFIPMIEKKDDRKRICLVRFGAYGDMIFMTLLIDHYKRSGYHVTLCTTERGNGIFKNDPRLDDVMFIESGVVSDAVGVFEGFFAELAKQYDELINLSGTLESTLLPREGQDKLYGEDFLTRHAACNKNYIDAHFEKCGLPVAPKAKPKIWLSESEISWAYHEVGLAKKALKKSFVVLWNLWGSSFHKIYPWMYDVWGLVDANEDDIGFITISDQEGKILEDKRLRCVFRRAGRYSIRQTLALHSVVRAVVTPETLSLVAGFAFDAPIVALLSHSSPEQYYWREQDVVLYPTHLDCPCYPCHQIHYSRLSCPRGKVERSATLCMDSIAPVDVYEAIKKIRGEAAK